MKITAYQPTVQLNTTQARNSVNILPDAYGANQSGLKALAGVAQNAAEMVNKEMEEKMAVDVTHANNIYNQKINALLNDPEKGLLNAQGKNAEGVMSQYQAEEKKIREDVLKSSGIQYQKAADTFNRMADSSMTSTMGGIENYQQKQRKVYIGSTLDDALNTTQNLYLTGTKDAESLNRAIGDITAKYKALGGGALGMDEIQIKQGIRKATDALVSSGIEQAVGNENFDQADKILRDAAGHVDEAAVMGYRGKINKLRDAYKTKSLAETTYAKYGNDIEGAVKEMVGQMGVKSAPTTPAKYSLSASASLDGLAPAAMSAGERTIAQYNALHPDDPITITEGVRAENAGYGAAQSAHKLSQGGAALDVVSPGLENDPAKRKEFVALAEQNGFDYVRDEYSDPSEGATGGHIHMGNPTATPEQGGELNQAAAEEKARNAYMEVVSKARQQTALKVDETKKTMMQTLVQNPDWSTAEQLSYVQQLAGDDPDLQAGLFTVIHGLRNNLKAEAKAAEHQRLAEMKAGDLDVHNLKVMYNTGMLKSKQEAADYMARTGKYYSESQLSTLNDYFDKKDSGQGIQVSDYMGTLKRQLGVSNDVWDTWKGSMEVLLQQKIADYQKENGGQMPGYDEVIGMGKELAAEQSTGMIGHYGWFKDDVLKLSDLEVKKWGYTGYEPLPGTGYIRFYKGDSGYVDVATSTVWDKIQSEKK